MTAALDLTLGLTLSLSLSLSLSDGRESRRTPWSSAISGTGASTKHERQVAVRHLASEEESEWASESA